MDFGFAGTKTKLVPLDFDRHFENCYLWMNDPVVTEWMCHGDRPLSRLTEREWFERCSAESRTDITFAIETFEGVHIGNTGIHNISHVHGTCQTGSVIGDRSYWNKGYATDMIQVRLRYIFEVLGLRQAYSSFLKGNVASERMQLRAGCKRIGERPASVWKRGRFRDEVLMMIDRDTWLRRVKQGDE